MGRAIRLKQRRILDIGWTSKKLDKKNILGGIATMNIFDRECNGYGYKDPGTYAAAILVEFQQSSVPIDYLSQVVKRHK